MCVDRDDPWKVHFILNSNGGVGKSFIAFLLAQYYCQLQASVVCFDADATTSTFSSFAALDVTRIELMQGPRIDERRFDLILTDDAHAVIDTGTSSHVSLSNYLIENDVQAGRRSRHHCWQRAHVFRLLQRTPATFGADLAQMMKQHLTFAEAIASPDFSIMARQRLT